MQKNILFIMYDQLRHDYLGCAGHPTIRTPHMDTLAARGVRFSNAYVQSPVCGASRMSTYTGRYVHSHGAAYNGFPLRVGEMTLGDHLRSAGLGCWLIGKTHMKADAAGMARLGLTPDSVIGARQAECGFDVWERDDGLWASGPHGPYDDKRSPYNEYLKHQGYAGDNPWADFANAGANGDDLASGWFMQNAARPANIREQDSETPWLTRRAMAFLDQAQGPWCAHVSFIKPHWPYIVPAPYHDMYTPQDVVPALRDAREKDNPHPVYGAFMDSRVGQSFSRDEVRDVVIPAYMGLITQCDDQLGVLLAHLKATGQDKDTVIVLTSDHGDYLGDHWMGEKDLFHDPSVRVPLIICDPSPAADATRGTTCDALVESIDLAATFIDVAGAQVPRHIVEGRSLRPFLNGETVTQWREHVISEYDYSKSPMRAALGVSIRNARLFMVADKRWKLIHAEGGFRPMLFDRKEDPQEFVDLGASDAHRDVIAQMYAHLANWARRPSQRVTISDAQIEAGTGTGDEVGILLGAFSPEDVAPDVAAVYQGKIPD
nr:sulfatase-like hydrolase/transferase [Sulfitobacter sp. JL08]